jgi:proteasome lid subunit RPN8/RPN11
VIVLPPSAEVRIRSAVEAAFPNECCGVLLGRVTFGDLPHSDRREVVDVVPIDNSHDAAEQFHRFTITPEQYLAAELDAARRGLDLLGFYHSHPEDLARPSEYDRLRALPNLSYIVVSAEATPTGPAAREVTSWELSEDRSQFLPEALSPS